VGGIVEWVSLHRVVVTEAERPGYLATTTLVPAATPPITTILFFLLVDMCIGIIDIQGNENLQCFCFLKLSSFRIPSIAAYL